MQEKKIGLLLLAFALGLLGGSGVAWWWSGSRMRAVVQAEAVKAGHARYKVVDEYGKSAFEWLPKHGQEPAEQK